jgi:predicted membrane metal-binding protein
LDSLLYNRKDYTSTNIVMASTIGVISLFSASGLLYGGVLRGFTALLKLRLSDKKSLRDDLAFRHDCFFPSALAKSGSSGSTSSSDFSASYNEVFFKKKFRYLDLVSFAGLLLLLIDFHFVYQSGFLLGFGASYVLLFSRDIIERKDKRWRPFYSSLTSLCLASSYELIERRWPPYFLPVILGGLFAVCLFVSPYLGGLSFVSVPFEHVLPFLSNLIGRILSFFNARWIFVCPSRHGRVLSSSSITLALSF